MMRVSLSQAASYLSAVALIWGCCPATCSAQSLFGSNGAISQSGGSSFGGSAGTTNAARSSSGFTSAFGGTNQAGGALDTSGLGNQTGVAGPQLNTELGALSATIGQGGFVGGSDTAGRFVGNQTAGQQAIQGTNAGGLGQFGGGQFGGQNSGFNQQNNANRQMGMQSRRVIRPRQKIAFDFPERVATGIQTNLSTQFQRLSTTRPELEGVQIQLGTDQQVVLRGEVRSEDDKKLAAMLARLEPGVRSVKNELTILPAE